MADGRATNEQQSESRQTRTKPHDIADIVQINTLISNTEIIAKAKHVSTVPNKFKSASII